MLTTSDALRSVADRRHRRFFGLLMVTMLAVPWGILGCASAGSRTIDVIARRIDVPTNNEHALVSYRLGIRGHEPDPRAVVFYFQGSGFDTALRYTEQLAGALVFDMPVVLSERRGVDIEGTVDRDVALEAVSLDARVADALRVLDAHLEGLEEGLPVIIAGGSEGADVAAGVAAADPRVTHLILLAGGGGWTQAEELRHFIREKGSYIGLDSEADLDARLQDIRRNPDALTMWAGHPYRRWSSFLWRSSSSDLRTLNIPILMLHGQKDTSVPIESARALASLFDHLEKDNLSLIEYPDLDHAYYDQERSRSGLPSLELDIIEWLLANELIDNQIARAGVARVKRAHPWLLDAPRNP